MDGSQPDARAGDASTVGPQLRHNRDYLLLWSGSAISALGSQMSAIAYPLLVLSLTGSAVRAGAVGSVALGGALLLRLPAGVWVDRWNRRRIMIISDAVRGLVLASVAVAYSIGQLGFVQILVVSFVEGCGGVFYRPSATAAIRRVVRPDQIRTAVAADEARANAATLIGPTVGGALFGLSRLLPFAADAATYAYSLLAAFCVRTPLTPQRADGHRSTTMQRDLGDGLRWIQGHPMIRLILIVAAATNFLIVGLQLATLVIARQHGASSAQIGLMLAIASAGGIVGALLAPTLTRLLNPTRLVVILTWTAAATIPVMAAWQSIWVLGGMLAARMLLTPAANTVLIGYQIAHTPDEMQGRVASTGYLIAGIASPIAPITVGALLVATTPTSTLLTLTAVAMVTAIALSASPSVRQRALNTDARRVNSVDIANPSATGTTARMRNVAGLAVDRGRSKSSGD